MRTHYILAVAAVVISAIVIAIYWPGLQGGFFFDDGPSILQADGVQLQSLSSDSLHQAWSSGGAGPSGRPVAQLTFALNHYFNGFEPFAFKATNLAIHLICGFLVFGLANHLIRATSHLAKSRPILFAPVGVASMWLLHPIQLLPVLHVVQRMTSLSALFLLAALLLHISAREPNERFGTLKLFVAWAVLWPLSFLSKETGALFPLFVLAWEMIVRRHAFGQLDRFALAFAALVGSAMLATMAYGLSPRGQWLWSGYDLRSFSVVERVLTEGRVLWFYLRLILLSQFELFGLYHDDIELSTDLVAPWTTLPALVGLGGLVWLAWRARIRAPLLSFGIVWFFIGHLLESTALPLETAHEHRNYLPLFGVLLVGAWALERARQLAGNYQTVGTTLAAVMLVNVTFVTALRSHQFEEDGRRTQIEAQHHRSSARAQFDAGQFMADRGDAQSSASPSFHFAAAHLQLSCNLALDGKMCWLGLINLNCQAGEPLPPDWTRELSRRLRETPFAPADRNVLYGLKEMAIAGKICLSRPEIDGLFAAALANSSVTPAVQAMLHSWHADYLWLRENDMVAARHALGQSLILNPGNASNRLKWAQLLFIAGEHDATAKLLLTLRGENLSGEERKTLAELAAAININP